MFSVKWLQQHLIAQHCVVKWQINDFKIDLFIISFIDFIWWVCIFTCYFIYSWAFKLFYTEEKWLVLNECHFLWRAKKKSNCIFKNLPCMMYDLLIYRGLRVGIWGWPWAGRLLAASWRVLSVGAAGACLAWWGDRRGRTGEKRGGWETQKDTKQNQYVQIRTGLKHMRTRNHSHNKCSHGNIQICRIFDLPNANSKLK